MIKAEIILDSINNKGSRITSFILTFPRIILAEAKTHRIISGFHNEIEITEDISINSFKDGSKNSASSRAIPLNKMVKMVDENPFIPIYWQKDHKGMQGTEYFTEVYWKIDKWLDARNYAVKQATLLHEDGVTKQLCNRLLEPFMWHKVLVTATDFTNFFNLRCPKYEVTNQLLQINHFKSKKEVLAFMPDYGFEEYTDFDWLNINKSQAEIHMQILAENMYDAMNESIPKLIYADDWHLPFSDNLNDLTIDDKIKVCVARAARLSYMTFDGKIDYDKDFELYKTLLKEKHASPFEHAAKSMSNRFYYANFKGWESYRHILNL